MHIRHLFFTVAAAIALAACGAIPATAPAAQSNSAPAAQSSAPAVTVGNLQISNVWARVAGGMAMDNQPTAQGGMAGHSSAGGHGGMGSTGGTGGMGAAYMTITNSGAADKLIKAESGVAKSVELHTMEMKDGVMQMRPVEGGIDIPANGEQQLKPGGFHVMLIGMNQALKAGDTVALKLTFEKAGTVDVSADVRPLDR